MKNVIDGLMVILFTIGVSTIDSPNFLIPITLIFLPFLWIAICYFMERDMDE